MEERDEKELERIRRINLAEKIRKELLINLRKKRIMKPTKTELENIEKRKLYWKKYRESKEDFNVDGTIFEAGNITIDNTGCRNTTTASESPQEERDKERGRRNLDTKKQIQEE